MESQHLIVNFILVAAVTISLVLGSGRNISLLDVGGDITRLAYDDSSNIYIGGDNFVAKVSSKFNLVRGRVTLGPVLEDWNCRPLPAPCDNVVQTLVVIQELDMLLVCGSAYNGTCSLHRLNDLTIWTCLVNGDTQDDAGMLSSQYEDMITVHLHSTNYIDSTPGAIATVDNNTCRPAPFGNLSQWPSENRDMSSDAYSNSSSHDPVGNAVTKLMVARYMPSQSFVSVSIRQILFDGYQHIIKYDRHDTDGGPTPKITRLGQRLNSSTEFKLTFTWDSYSFYVSSPKDNTEETKLVRVSDSSMFQTVQTTLVCVDNGAQSDAMVSLPDGLTENAILTFNTSIINIFTYTQRQGEQLEETVEVYLLDEKSSLIKMDLKVVYENHKYRLKSLFPPTQVSTLDGVLGLWRNEAVGFVDQSRALLYIAVGSKILKVNLDHCSQFETCQECNKTCIWSSSKKVCLRKGATFRETLCPPFIDSVHPEEFPSAGGTLLTLMGRDFGIDSSLVAVTVCNQTCKVANLTARLITCTVEPILNTCPGECYVQMNKNESSIITRDEGQVTLKCVTPHVASFSPHFGPVSGGYRLNFKGHNLASGSHVNITVAGRQCNVIQRNSTELNCKLSKPTTKDINCGPVTIHIDNFNQKLINHTFCYRADPVVKQISPASILMSGGTTVTVSGDHFDSIRWPRLILNVTDIKNITQTFSEPCQNHTTRLTCLTPATSEVLQKFIARNNSTEYIPGTVAIGADSQHFKLNKSIKIYRDPEFNCTQFTVEDVLKTKVLILQGKYLPFWSTAINVTIGDIHCHIKSKSNRSIECECNEFLAKSQDGSEIPGASMDAREPSNDETTSVHNDTHLTSNTTTMSSDSPERRRWPIVVTIGHFQKVVGHITAPPSKVGASTGGVNVRLLVGVVASIVVLLVVVVIVNCVVHKRRHKHSKRPVFIYGSKNDLHMQPLKEILTSIGDQVRNEDLDKLIITLDNLTIGKPLGSGNFGCVYEGLLKTSTDQESIKVAVKTVKDPTAHNIDLAAFIQEALIMKDFRHNNVLELIGLGEREPGNPYVILPYMDNGDLLSYVRNKSISLSLHDVIKFGADIASGMAYLSSLKFVHRDLAARNCMLDSGYTVKVADFGLCRDIYEKGYYSSDNKKMLPIRWMAVESIEHGSYSTKSDVWSFGVVLWELLTRGLTPYPGIDGWDILNFLRQRRLARPHFCPPILYKYMTSCWAYKAELRPTFTSLATDLYEMIGYVQRGQTSPSSAGITKPDVPNFKMVYQDIITIDSQTVEHEPGLQSSKFRKQSEQHNKSPSENTYAILERASTITNSVITVPLCYTLVQTCTFPELNDHQTAEHRTDSSDQSYMQVMDHYDPIKSKYETRIV